MNKFRATLCLLLLTVIAFTLAVCLQPRIWSWSGNDTFSAGAMKILFGGGRQSLAGLFYRQADVTLHSGYYPSIFSQAQIEEENEDDVTHSGSADHDHALAKDSQREPSVGNRVAEDGGFMEKPADWIEGFGRHFMITEHTHLEGQGTREILPWLRISADLDPHNVLTYTVAAYWLRKELRETDKAEQFLREGLRVNPDSYEILFELGCLYDEARHDPTRASNIWQLALRRWSEKEKNQKDPDFQLYDNILDHLAHVAEEQGDYADAIHWFEQAKEHSPSPAALRSQIDALRAKLATQRPKE